MSELQVTPSEVQVEVLVSTTGLETTGAGTCAVHSLGIGRVGSESQLVSSTSDVQVRPSEVDADVLVETYGGGPGALLLEALLLLDVDAVDLDPAWVEDATALVVGEDRGPENGIDDKVDVVPPIPILIVLVVCSPVVTDDRLVEKIEVVAMLAGIW